MSTVIRSTISNKNKYYISKHRYYELKHFCMQYKEWVHNRTYLILSLGHEISYKNPRTGNYISDEVAEKATELATYDHNIERVEQACKEADPCISDYIFKSVTEGLSYVTLSTKYDIPCGKDYFYERYRKFFYILSKN